MDMDAMITSIIGIQIHSTGIMAGATAGRGDHGVVGTAHCGAGIRLTLGITGAGVAVGATTLMDMVATGVVLCLAH